MKIHFNIINLAASKHLICIILFNLFFVICYSQQIKPKIKNPPNSHNTGIIKNPPKEPNTGTHAIIGNQIKEPYSIKLNQADIATYNQANDNWVQVYSAPMPDNHMLKFTYTLQNKIITKPGKMIGDIDGTPLVAPQSFTNIVTALPPNQNFQSVFLSNPLSPGKHLLHLKYITKGLRFVPLTGTAGTYDSTAAAAEFDYVVNVTVIDKDNDGIDDRNEQMLLEKYSPYYKYSFDLQEEEFRPTDAIWYIQHCNLLTSRNGTVNISKSSLQNAATLVDISNHNSGNSSISINHNRTSYSLSLENPIYSAGYENGDGHDWPEILTKANIGLYGHVTPVLGFSNRFKVEYWQFFAYNRATTGWIGFVSAVGGPQFAAAGATVGDHAGDWTTVQLIVQGQLGSTGFIDNSSIISILHYHHGDESRFDMGNTKMSRIVSGNIKEFAQGDSYDADNTVELLMDSHSGLFVHPVVYIEWGGYEFWPNTRGSQLGAPKHNGTGKYAYMCHNIPNVGEVESPIGTDAKTIFQFNGYWDSWNNQNSNPPGPAMHNEWQWPANSVIYPNIPKKSFTN